MPYSVTGLSGLLSLVAAEILQHGYNRATCPGVADGATDD